MFDSKDIEDHSSSEAWKADIETPEGDVITVQYTSRGGEDPLEDPDPEKYRLREGEEDNIRGDYEPENILVLDVDEGDIGYGSVDVFTLVPEEKIVDTYMS